MTLYLALLFTFLAAVCVVVAFMTRLSWRRVRALLGMALCVVMAVIMFRMDGRRDRALAELAQLIRPLPEITDVSRRMSGEDAAALEEAMHPGGNATLQADMDGAIYSVDTDFPANLAIDFYHDPENLRGWIPDTENSSINPAKTLGLLLFTRGEERLVVFIREDWTETEVVYAHAPAP